ncbi:Hypothetical protein, putative [Bodo saltans]|uniref:Voltage-gated hydrogen channel 1 n=1 Tax=Bodo saltans TaxID=75058 RepID=A0A0S4JJZ9_BODSA|nr:Hypothetical protein, putative [Bodo saltans]|eukprot:CUG90888.1 Hypothetical protein, putative [Bodo saltans]
MSLPVKCKDDAADDEGGGPNEAFALRISAPPNQLSNVDDEANNALSRTQPPQQVSQYLTAAAQPFHEPIDQWDGRSADSADDGGHDHNNHNSSHHRMPLRPRASSALLWRQAPPPQHDSHWRDTEQPPIRAYTPVPPRRATSSHLRRSGGKVAVRNSLLANLFFPNEASHRVTTVDEAKAARHNNHLHHGSTSLPLTPRDDHIISGAATSVSSRSNTSTLQRRRRHDDASNSLNHHQRLNSNTAVPSSTQQQQHTHADGISDGAGHDDHHDDGAAVITFLDDGSESSSSSLPADTCVEAMARAIQSQYGQWFFTALLVLDVMLIIAELVIESNQYCVLEPVHDVHHVGGTYNTTNALCNTTVVSYIGSPEANHRARFFESSQAHCPFEAIPELPHPLHVTEAVLKWLSKSIIFAFAAELLVLIAALRVHFFRNKMYVLDLLIVGVSIIVDWTVSSNQPSVQLVVIVRCWRFARILHGVGSSVHDTEEIVVEAIIDENGNVVAEELLSAAGEDDECHLNIGVDDEESDRGGDIHHYHRANHSSRRNSREEDDDRIDPRYEGSMTTPPLSSASSSTRWNSTRHPHDDPDHNYHSHLDGGNSRRRSSHQQPHRRPNETLSDDDHLGEVVVTGDNSEHDNPLFYGHQAQPPVFRRERVRYQVIRRRQQ